MASDDAPIAETKRPARSSGSLVDEPSHCAEADAAPTRCYDVVLEPLSHRELGEIRITRELFAVGRAEAPFASARAEVVAELSRRHAKIFFERGDAYVADLSSKNGTTVGGVEVRERPRQLRDGDTLSFAGVFTYRVAFVPRDARADAGCQRSVLLTLTPERGDLGLEPIVVTTFPFLISKTDETFSRYRSTYAHQVNYLSRRHAHFFVADGKVFIEDLGSTNGTFLDGKRLDEGAQPLEDGARLAFGGNHFVYRVGVKSGTPADPTVTQVDAAARAEAANAKAPAAAIDARIGAAGAGADADRTTFIAAPHSFLDIFCVDPARAEDDEINPDAVAPAVDSKRAVSHWRWSARLATVLSELSAALGGGADVDIRKIGRWAGAALALLAALAVFSYWRGAPQRDMKTLLAAARYETASRFADQYLAQHPDDAAFQSEGAEALVKSKVPDWIGAEKAHAFDRARSIAAQMRQLARHNAQAGALVDEIEWIGDLEAFWASRGGAQAPVAIYRDEPVIEGLVARWNRDTNAHQHALDQIASYVPAFGEFYADALSHLRALESDNSVYVAALERLQTAIAKALDDGRDDQLDALSNMLADYGDRYPRLAGLDRVRDDLQRYRQIERDVRAGRADEAAAALKAARFATPPFQARVPALAKRVGETPRSAP
ncbi:FHA domain-containing protein [Trinickia symbiotica]|nr:FHA domain-containing protein [Trinickia symbiotica]